MAGLDDMARKLQAYTFFGGPPPEIDDGDLIQYVRAGLSEVSGQTSGKDPIIGGIRLLGERGVISARETFELAAKDANKGVRDEAERALSSLFLEASSEKQEQASRSTVAERVLARGEPPDEALRLYNIGVDLAEGGEPGEATRVWKEALTKTSSTGLEVMILSNLVISITHDIFDLPMGATLSDEQGIRFKNAEELLVRLNLLCLGEATEGPVQDLAPEVLAQYRDKTKRMTLDFARRFGRGYWYLPNGESGPRMVEFGWAVADAKMFDVAVEALSKAIAILDPKTQSGDLWRAHARLATILNKRGQRHESVKHAKAALAAGLTDSENEFYYLAMESIIEVGGEPPPEAPQSTTQDEVKRGCFIATAASGSSRAPEVLVLSQFRDDVLLRSVLGRAVTRVYCSWSPRAAAFIVKRRTLRAFILVFLIRPAVYFIKRRIRRETRG